MYKIISHPGDIRFVDFYNRNNFHVILSNYGASIYEIDAIDKDNNLECVTLSPIMIRYFNNDRYYGLTIARVAGRIKDAQFTVNKELFRIKPNENKNLLHSGYDTTAYRLFDFKIDDNDDETIVTYSLKIKDKEDGFPGNLDLRVVYTLYKGEDTINVRYLALSDKDTILNITNHSYFNLSGNLKSPIDDELLSVNKELLGVMDDELIISSLEDVPEEYDFRNPMPIGKYFSSEKVRETGIGGYDHLWSGKNPLHITLYSEKNGRYLEIDSNYKDVIMYTNNDASQTVFPGNTKDRPHLGIAIEPQRYSRILKNEGLMQKANQLYDYFITYKFGVK